MPGEFFDLPADQICRHPAHLPPTGLYIPPGKGYRHTCPACGNTQSIVPTQVLMGVSTHWKTMPTCWCETCRPNTLSDMRMVLCPNCGNKRCPKANHHDNACTNSNAPGQPGSSWEHVKPSARKGLSDERIKSIYFSCPDSAGTVEGFIKHARAIEAAHGIQGEGNE